MADTFSHLPQFRHRAPAPWGPGARCRFQVFVGPLMETVVQTEAGASSPLETLRRDRDDGRLDEAAVLDALGKGDRVFVTAALAALAGVPVEVVQKAVSLEGAKGLIALAW